MASRAVHGSAGELRGVVRERCGVIEVGTSVVGKCAFVAKAVKVRCLGGTQVRYGVRPQTIHADMDNVTRIGGESSGSGKDGKNRDERTAAGTKQDDNPQTQLI
jgi:hypothetical protein